MFPWHQYLFAVLLIAAGFNHFRVPKIYERIMPKYFPAHGSLVLLSGIVEMSFGLLLLNQNTQVFAAWGIIAMLLLFLTVHIDMVQQEKKAFKLPNWLLWARIPLQFILIYWAFQYT